MRRPPASQSDDSDSDSSSESEPDARRASGHRRAHVSRSKLHRRIPTTVRKLASYSCDLIDSETGQRNSILVDKRASLHALAKPALKILSLCKGSSHLSSRQSLRAVRRLITTLCQEVVLQDEDVILSLDSSQAVVSKLRGRDGSVILTGAVKRKFESLKAEQRAERTRSARTAALSSSPSPSRSRSASPSPGADDLSDAPALDRATKLAGTKCHGCGAFGHYKAGCPARRRN